MTTETELWEKFEELRSDNEEWLRKKYRMQDADIDDVMQDAIIKAIEYLREHKPTYDNLEAVIRQTIRCVTINAHVAEKRRPDSGPFDQREAEKVIDEAAFNDAVRVETCDDLKAQLGEDDYTFLLSTTTPGWTKAHGATTNQRRPAMRKKIKLVEKAKEIIDA